MKELWKLTIVFEYNEADEDGEQSKEEFYILASDFRSASDYAIQKLGTYTSYNWKWIESLELVSPIVLDALMPASPP